MVAGCGVCDRRRYQLFCGRIKRDTDSAVGIYGFGYCDRDDKVYYQEVFVVVGIVYRAGKKGIDNICRGRGEYHRHVRPRHRGGNPKRRYIFLYHE